MIYGYALTMPYEYTPNFVLGGASSYTPSTTFITLQCDLNDPRYRIDTFTECICEMNNPRRLCPRHDSGLCPAEALAIGLLLVCRKTYQECAPMIYSSNVFTLDTPTLQRFLIQIGPAHAAQLRHLYVVDVFDKANGLVSARAGEFEYRRQHGSYANLDIASRVYYSPQYFQLAALVNLETLRIPTFVYAKDDNTPDEDAEFLVNELFLWMEAVGRSKGKKDACLKIIKFKFIREKGVGDPEVRKFEGNLRRKIRNLLVG